MDTKRCSRCKDVKSTDDFSRNRSRKDGLCQFCRDCASEYNRERRSTETEKTKNKTRCRAYYLAHAEKVKGARKHWYEENPACAAYHSHKSNAKRRGIPWDLSKEWFLAHIWDHQCAYSHHPADGGIDRIDSSKGYEPGNCVPCCFRCNSVKNDQTLGEMYQHIADMLVSRDERQRIGSTSCRL